MDIFLFNLEIMGLSAVLVGIYPLKSRLGLVPMYMMAGLFLAFMVLGGRLRVEVPVLGGGVAWYTSLNHLALLLTIVVLIYALEGTQPARRMVWAVFVSSLFLYLLRLLLAVHLTQPGVDLAQFGRQRWIHPGLWSCLISSIALLVDGIAILVIYQSLVNLSRHIPQVVTLALALVAAMVIDGLVYGSLSGSIDFSQFGGHLLGKLSAGIAASIPAATYIAFQFRRHPEQLRAGVLERGAFEIMALRRQVRTYQEAFLKSQAEYQSAKQLFSRYVTPDVVDEILKDTSALKLGGELREVTILFADIRGYSTLSESMSPEETIELLNEYFGAMSEVINAKRGTIIEFEGDAILTVFGAPLTQPDHAERAVRTGLRMLQRVDELNEEWDAAGTSEHWHALRMGRFRIRIGIHTGPVVVGNVGSETHTKYAVIGDTVNTAARIEQLNKKLRTTLLVSATTAEQIGQLGLELEDQGSHPVKGRMEEVHVYSVKDMAQVYSTVDIMTFLKKDR